MKKGKIICMATMVCGALALGVATANAETVTADAATSTLTTDTFVMEEGAAVRIKDETVETTNADGTTTAATVSTNGLRFSAEIGATEYEALNAAGAEFGVMIVANDLIGGDASKLTVENIFGENGAFYFNASETSDKIYMTKVRAKAENVDTDDNIEICGALTNILTGNLTRPFVGVAYVAIPTATEETTVGTDENGNEITETVVTEYEYRFAPFYGGDAANNTRCMYYVAQRALESTTESDDNKKVLQEKYIDEFAPKAEGKLYRYTVIHHYPQRNEDGSEKTDEYGTLLYDMETETCGGTLNATVTVESATTAKEGYVFDDIKTANRNTGLVYAAGMQTLNVYYRVETENSGGNSAEGDTGTGTETKKSVSDLLSAADASEKYFGGSLTYTENGELVSVDSDSGLAGLTGGGQTAVVFTAQFLYDLQQNGYSTITIGKLWSTPTTELGGFASTQKVVLTGYVSGTDYEYARSDGDIVNETVTDESGSELTRTYITHSITIKLEQTIYYNETDSSYYLDEEYTTKAEGVNIQCHGYFGEAAVGRDWVFDNLMIA